jgi:hypothetical protein
MPDVRRNFPHKERLQVFDAISSGGNLNDQREMQKRLFICYCLVVAMVFTAGGLAWSAQHGKLAVPPDYDDRQSMVEGAVRLLNMKSFGFAAS